ncbi:hypothetical protein SAMN02927921_00748 [Sinomicrobium oceani]|uniref:Uncharacterized protein n=1 Tax=Sinomicrobium oceani TaxID=1150368 RepID=A0A1K1MRC8_9FLAO|nr:hypothetical protein [Sinomicrobium oceani]SFW25557.1 hypothetical protein SAMN02927921_00748 [Sinomicrobium oceani]
MNKNHLYLILFLICASCNKKAEFFPLTEIGKEYSHNKSINEYIVISNPPKNIDSLANLISQYNDTTINLCQIKKDSVWLMRIFYKESWNMSKNYKENHSYFGDYVVADHLDDIIAVFQKTGNSEEYYWEFKIKTHNNPDEWKEYPVEIDCPN